MTALVRRFAVVGSIVVLSGLALAVDHAAQWEQEITGAADTYRGAWCVASAKKLLVLGGSDNPSSDRSAFSLWALDEKSGDVVWENHLIREVARRSEVDAIAAKGKYVVACGRTGSEEGGRAFSVVGYDARRGEILWQDHLDVEDTQTDVANDVAIGGRTAVAVGYTTTTAESLAFTVRAYDLKTGELRWEDIDQGLPGKSDSAQAVAIRGKRVFVAGTRGTAEGFAAMVRTYDLRDGRLLWEYVDSDETALRTYYSEVQIVGSRLYLAGARSSTFSRANVFVRALSASSGGELWRQVLPTDGSGYESPGALSADRKAVAIGGRTFVEGNGTFSVWSLDPRSGAIQWAFHRERPVDATGDDEEVARVIAIGRKAIYAGGTVGTAQGGAALAVFALARGDGEELWSSLHDTAAQEYGWGGGSLRGRLILTGEREHANGDWSVPVLSYKAK